MKKKVPTKKKPTPRVKKLSGTLIDLSQPSEVEASPSNDPMMTAWIMFENHTFQQVRAPYSKIADEIKKVAELEKGMFGGWGRLTFDGISSDDFALIGGLHQIDKLSQIQDINFALRIDEKMKQIEESVAAHEATITKHRDAITKLQVLRSTVKSLEEIIPIASKMCGTN